MYSLGLDSPEATEHLNRQLLTVDVINKLAEHLQESPAPTSDMATLNALAPEAPVPILDSVRAGLEVAKDSLNHITAIFRENDKFTLVTLQSMMRMALLGASRAAFILGPEDPSDRERNAHIVLAQEAQSLRRALDACSDFKHLRGMIPSEEFRNEITERTRTLQPTPRHGEATTIRLMAEETAQQVARDDPNAPSPEILSEALAWAWHSSSGTAHAYAWPRIAGGDFVSDFGMIVPVAHIAFDAAVRRWR
ncbi:hypothetical protein [Rhodococcus sp. APC 3903]|uniref:hypothetical protein n=1 Tax=Rhodococcus sp. APC 3903 TaxID=3035193 RepID=UPI0025B5E5E4|nr:hypothetical protein [Rhodococcus sp. APC 3903]MDN3461059.1 hypothetical protein [Rhodococcus sp. APC 3903]